MVDSGHRVVEIPRGRVMGRQAESLERRLDIWHLEEDCLVGNSLIIEQESNTPDDGRKANVLDTS